MGRQFGERADLLTQKITKINDVTSFERGDDFQIRSHWESGKIYTKTFIQLLRNALNSLMNNGGVHILERYGIRFRFIGHSDRSKFEAEFEQWIAQTIQTYDENPLSRRNVLMLLLASGLLQPILWEDWGVDRSSSIVAQGFGIKSFESFQDVLAERVDGNLSVLHLGSGDQSTLEECKRHDVQRGAEWKHVGVGDKLYFPPEKIFQKFVLDVPELKEFVRILSLFITREFRKKSESSDSVPVYSQRIYDLNDFYQILAGAHEWIDLHYDREHGKYKGSAEFEQDSQHLAKGKAKELMDRISRREDLNELYREVFRADFCEGIFSGSPSRINLNSTIPDVYLKGFIYSKFQNLPAFVPAQSVAFALSFKGDSHLNDHEFVRHVYNTLVFLKPGGGYLTNGAVESYTRGLRFERVLSFIRDLKGQFRAFVAVDKSTQRPLSLYIERGRAQRDDFEFASDEQLCRQFDLDAVDLVPLSDFVGRSDIRIETHYRKSVLNEFDGNREVFFGKNDLIQEAIQIICRQMNSCIPLHELSSGKDDNGDSPQDYAPFLSRIDAIRGFVIDILSTERDLITYLSGKTLPEISMSLQDYRERKRVLFGLSGESVA